MLNFRLKKFAIAGWRIFTLSMILWAFSTAGFSQSRENKQYNAPAADHKSGLTEAQLVQQKRNGVTNQTFPSDARGNNLGPAPASLGSGSRNFTNGSNIVDPNSRAFIYNGAGPFQLRKHPLPTPGALTAVGPTQIFGFPGATAVNSSNQRLYVVDQAAPFALYFVDTVTGNRFFVKNLTGVPQANLTGITWDATTNQMFGISSSITVSSIFKINLATGVCTPIGAPSALVAGGIQLNAAPSGSLFTVDIVTDALYKWNKVTGVPTLVGPLGLNANFGQDGHFDADGQYYWAAYTTGPQLRILDTTNGSSTLVGNYGSQSATLGIYSQPTVACSGTPNPGNTQTTDTSVCPFQTYALTLQNVTPGTGVTYQWQTAPSATGPWTNAGPNSFIYSVTAPAAPVGVYYRCIVTCGANSGTSTPVFVAGGSGTQCYCTAGATSTAFEKISNVKFTNVNQASTSTAGYENFLTDTATVIRQATNPITVTISTPFSTDQVLVWIDLNQNGSFSDAGELVYTSPLGAGPHTGNITIPITATLGYTRMRVRMHDTGAGPNATPCGTSTYGQVEDYTINILPCVPLAITASPVDKTVPCGSATFFRVQTTGSSPVYQWQYRTTATGTWLVVPNAAPYSGVSSDTLRISPTSSSLNGYQYRALVSGACAAATPSAAATLTISNVAPSVTPSSAVICAGTIQKLTLNNVDAPSPTTVTFSSGTINKLIPDNNATGIKDTIAVSVPAGAGAVTKVAVRFNLPHTWPGDIAIVLKSPNGQIVNLDYFLSGTGNGPGTGFVNTVISSDPAVTATLGATSTSPVTGTFKFDGAFGALAPATGPTGFIATTAQFSAAFPATGPTGNWVLGIYDAFGGDIGTLTNWSLDITYLLGTPSNGIWSPTGTIFTDPAATVPYTGTPANTVYVKPTATTNYKVYIPNAACSSDTTTVTITVSAPPTAVAAVANKAVCVGGNATFTSSVTGGSNTVQNWQVSTDGGATYTNLANGGVYSGVTTNTLTITGVTTAMNGYKYRLTVSAAPCAGTTTLSSTAGTLTVNPTPVVVLSASPSVALFPGITTTLSVAVSPNAAATYMWFKNGVLIPGVIGNTYPGLTVDDLGTYTVKVTDINGCTGISNAVTLRDSSNSRLFIYPSPNNGQFQVRFYNDPTGSDFGSPRGLVIYDSKGARVYAQTFSLVGPYVSMHVNLSNYGKGVYHVDLVDSRGNRLKTGSVVVL